MEIIKQNQNLTTSKQANEIACELFKLNLLVSYPYSDSILEAMALTLLRLIPDVKTKELETIMDYFLQGEIDYKNDKGLQNVIVAIKNLRRKQEILGSVKNNQW
jgi:hypothetical protein